MTVMIKSILICPRCDAGITASDSTTNCPECGLILGTKIGPDYQPPLTLTEQHLKFQDDQRHLEVLINLPIEKANSMLNDALNILETVTAKKVNISDIRNLMGMALRIGELAKAFDSYLQAGGKLVPSLFLEVEERKKSLTPLTTPSPTIPLHSENYHELQSKPPSNRGEVTADPPDTD